MDHWQQKPEARTKSGWLIPPHGILSPLSNDEAAFSFNAEWEPTLEPFEEAQRRITAEFTSTLSDWMNHAVWLARERGFPALPKKRELDRHLRWLVRRQVKGHSYIAILKDDKVANSTLATLFYTGLRRGELLGLKWQDVDFDSLRIHVRRAYVQSAVTTPKSGRARHVAMATPLASLLMDVLGARRKEALAREWPEVPEWIFCSETGGPLDQDNFERSWRRVRRRAQKLGVRPLRLHCTRHTWASLALAAGKSVRWVADQLGHADPALTLRVYARVIPDQENDLSFLDFSAHDDPRRPQAAPADDSNGRNKSAPERNRSGALEIRGAPSMTRTCDLQVRNLTLYPTELWARGAGL